MVTVALVGADGAGKTTVGRALPDVLGRPARYVYLGDNPASATHALPTTRLVHRVRTARGRAASGGPPSLDHDHRPRTDGSASVRARRGVRAAGRLANQLAEGGYQWVVIRWHRSRGRVVVVVRLHTADHHAHELAPGVRMGRARRLHARFIRLAFPAPDLVVVLDAPAEVLHARKGEGTVQEVARRRAEYLDYLRVVDQGQRVDAGRPLAEVLDDVVAAVDRALGVRP